MDLGLDADDDSDFDKNSDSGDQDVMHFSDNEDGVQVIEDFESYGKHKMKKELTQKKLEREAELRNVTKREISLRNELDRLLKTPLGAQSDGPRSRPKSSRREGGKQFEKTKKMSSSFASALEVIGLSKESSAVGPASAGAVAGGATGARRIREGFETLTRYSRSRKRNDTTR